jgi:hypothetical protein
MSLLKQIQASTLDKQCDVATLLRLCKVFATQVEASDLAQWATRELKGYGADDPLPDYRVLTVTSKGHFSGPYGSRLKNADIPIQLLPERFQEKYRRASIIQSVSSLQATVDESQGATLMLPWPTEAVQLFGERMYQHMHCVQAWKVISAGALRGVLDAVKTRVLDFTLALSERYPEMMEDTDNGAKQISPQELRQTFNTTIYGTVGAIANASPNTVQHVNISAGDRSALDRQLAQHGVPAEDVQKLHNAIEQDAADSPGRLGPKVREWLGAGLLKVAEGAWSTSLETAAKILPSLVAGYLGVELK